MYRYKKARSMKAANFSTILENAWKELGDEIVKELKRLGTKDTVIRSSSLKGIYLDFYFLDRDTNYTAELWSLKAIDKDITCVLTEWEGAHEITTYWIDQFPLSLDQSGKAMAKKIFDSIL